jgi:hypothetical protein
LLEPSWLLLQPATKLDERGKINKDRTGFATLQTVSHVQSHQLAGVWAVDSVIVNSQFIYQLPVQNKDVAAFYRGTYLPMGVTCIHRLTI